MNTNIFSLRKLSPARMAAAIGGVALAAAACSSGHHAAAPPGSNSTHATAESRASAAQVSVQVLHGPLGTYLADGSSRALYVFAADTGSKSNCSGTCATYWPPLIADGSVTAGAGAAGDNIATTHRSDGTEQVTYAGHPLYYYAGDENARETDGQGLDDFGGLWWLVDPAGQKITTTASSTSSSSSNDDAGGGW